MSEYHELVKEAVIARAGADRMAEGLSCIPDPIYGDIVLIQRLRHKLEMIHDIAQNTVEPAWQALDNIRATAASGLNRTRTERPANDTVKTGE